MHNCTIEIAKRTVPGLIIEVPIVTSTIDIPKGEPIRVWNPFPPQPAPDDEGAPAADPTDEGAGGDGDKGGGGDTGNPNGKGGKGKGGGGGKGKPNGKGGGGGDAQRSAKRPRMT